MNELSIESIWISSSFGSLLIRFGMDFLFLFLIVRYLYYPAHHRKDYLFTYFLFNTLIFFLSYMMSGVTVSIGFAFGLFAVFGILRYRTEAVPIREMTYLFMVITIAVMNSIVHNDIHWYEILFANTVLLLITFMLEKVWLVKHEARKLVIYDKIHLITPDKKEELLADLKLRTGLPVHKTEIIRIDLLRDTVMLNVYYYSDYVAEEEDVSRWQ